MSEQHEASRQPAEERPAARASRTPAEYTVGSEADFPPGSHKVVKAGTQNIGLFNVNGTFHALINVCPHQYGPVCNGPVGGEMVCNAQTDWKFQWRRDGEILTCPWHGLEFDLITGQCLAPKDFRIRKCNVRVVEGEVRISFGRGAAS